MSRPIADPPASFDSYWLVLLRPGDGEAEDAELVQAQHLGHLKRQGEEGVLLAAGPLVGAEGRDVRGILIYPGNLDEGEVRRRAEDDPAVRAGVFRAEVLQWLTPQGKAAFDPTAW